MQTVFVTRIARSRSALVEHVGSNVTCDQVASALAAPRRPRWGCEGRARRARRHSACRMAAAGGEGPGGVVNKAVAAGMLGLQLLSLPFAVVARQPGGLEELPRLEVVAVAAQARAPRTLEEEMIREWFVLEAEPLLLTTAHEYFTYPPDLGY